MLFNSYSFIFIFLPLALAGTFLLRAFVSSKAAQVWVFFSSCVFYMWHNPSLIILLFSSIGFNYLLGCRLIKGSESESKLETALLFLGIAGNVALLGTFKYTGSFVVPLAISFFTFTQISFLIDARQGLAPKYSLLDYVSFVTFFPYLISGPIHNHRDVIPQFKKENTFRFNWDNLMVGCTLFAIGLFKKVIIADQVAAYANPVFSLSSQGTPLSFFESWAGAFSYSFQIYFDFSGYCDMVLGLGRMLGFKLLLNFNSPYKAVNVIDFWNRWHMTLTRFLTNYIYNPIVLFLARQQAGKKVHPLTKFIINVSFPTLFTMFISGIWHGAGWQFIAFGLFHGLLMVINHAWHSLRKKWGHDLKNPTPLGRFSAQVLTFLFVTAAMVPFRAESLTAAFEMLKGLAFLNGVSLPRTFEALLGPMSSTLLKLGFTFEGMTLTPLGPTFSWVFGLLLFVWVLPNSQQIMQKTDPYLKSGIRASTEAPSIAIVWSPTLRWALFVGSVGAMAVVGLSQISQFIYFQF